MSLAAQAQDLGLLLSQLPAGVSHLHVDGRARETGRERAAAQCHTHLALQPLALHRSRRLGFGLDGACVRLGLDGARVRLGLGGARLRLRLGLDGARLRLRLDGARFRLRLGDARVCARHLHLRLCDA